MELKFATSNPHKVSEANQVGRKYGIEFVQLEQDYPEIRDEDVRMVARAGAAYVFNIIREPVIVEDTGLFIEGLGGFPGSYSAFVFNKIENQGILRLMQGAGDRKAEFISAIGYCDIDGVQIFDGAVRGSIGTEITGTAGFGYDSIFIPDGHEKTFGENPKLKAEVSHRMKAFDKFCKFIAECWD
ncbi:MAG: XTP/dITP diphosphatase [Candidatus Altiarchaeales archaeon]|nr:XTP/dITP diphosphatase [Candidatus Altiarchaeota archaeon]MBU4436705.1 XTP/dITP diphosphatase [Candidatus Altiarchaeota archaeon]MCG2782637.1 XTP/dITP diphosphatase [Candidatus Altiarchaeales archaeon]